MHKQHTPYVNRRASQQRNDRASEVNHTRARSSRRRTRRTVIVIVCALAILGSGVWLVFKQRPTPTAPASDERYYFTDSNYHGIRSKFATRQSAKEQSSIEYPITAIPKIDQTVAAAIDQHDQEFIRARDAGSSATEPMTQAISYQITHSTDKHLSIVVHIKQDTHGAHPLSAAHFWTFDRGSGSPVTLTDLVAGNARDIAAIVAAARQAASATLAQRKQPAANLEEAITAGTLQQFVVTNPTTIAWPFAQNAFLPSSYGEVQIALDIAQIATHLQHPIARQLFTVPAPPVTPQQQTTAPRGGGACPQQRCVALTFDDGPGPHTGRLLDTLSQRQAKATFYVLGSKVAPYTDQIRRIHTDGHQIGNHSWNHANLSKLVAADIRHDLTRTNDAIHSIIGVRPNSTRPPYGASSPAVQSTLAELGMSSVLWSVDTRDWADRDSSVVCHRAIANTRPGSIILLHDIHSTSVDAVPCIIDGLAKQGYGFVTVDTLLGKITPGTTYHAG